MITHENLARQLRAAELDPCPNALQELAKSCDELLSTEAVPGEVLPAVVDAIVLIDGHRNGADDARMDLNHKLLWVRRQYLEIPAPALARGYGPEHGRALAIVGILLERSGLPGTAIAPIELAAGVCRILAADDVGAHGLASANILRLLGARYHDLDCRDEAVRTTYEAVAIYHALAPSGLDEWRPELARTLDMLSLWLSEVGQLREAADAASESTALHRQLVAAGDIDHLAPLAGAAMSAAIWSGQLDETSTAVELASEAARCYRQLVASDADRYGSELAAALTVLAVQAAESGQMDVASEAGMEAARRWRSLPPALARPQLPGLATLLYEVAIELAGAERHEDAILTMSGSAETHRHLAKAGTSPEPTHLTGLAVAQSLSGTWLARSDSFDEAEPRLLEAVDLLRALGPDQPTTFWSNLAVALEELAGVYAGTNREDEAVSAVREAFQIFRQLAEEDPTSFRDHAARVERNLDLLERRRSEGPTAPDPTVPDPTPDRPTGPATESPADSDADRADRALLSEFFQATARLGGDPTSERLAELAPLTDALLAAGVPDFLTTGVAWVTVFLESAVDEADEASRARSARRITLALRLPGVEPHILGQLHRVHGRRLESLHRSSEAIVAYTKAVALLRSVPDRDEDQDLQLTLALHNLARLQERRGLRSDSLASFKEALAIRRRLAGTEADPDRSELAAAATNSAAALSSNGRYDEAIVVCREAVDLYRQLVAVPHARASLRAGLASALSNEGVICQNLGDADRAAEALEEAARIRRATATTDGETALALADTSMNLANALSALGRWDEALEHLESATATFRRLAGHDPVEDSLRLARALSNLAQSLVSLDRPEPAETHAAEAVALFRDLAAEIPAHRAELAASLNILASAQGGLGRPGVALTPAEEAVTLGRIVAAEDPLVHEPDLARWLANWAARLAEVGRDGDALTRANEALAIQRRLVETDRRVHSAALALSLSNIGSLLADAGRVDEAIEATEEAVTIRRSLASSSPAAHTGELAVALVNHGTVLSKAGQRDEAAGPAREAVEILRPLTAASPEAYSPQFAMALSNLGRLLTAIRSDEAVPVGEEAVAACAPLARANPAVHSATLAGAQSNLADILAAVARGEDAVRSAETAVALLEPLAEETPAVYLPDLAQALNNLGIHLNGVGRSLEAVARNGRAMALIGLLRLEDPLAFGPTFAVSLLNLGAAEASAGLAAESVVTTRRAVDAAEAVTAEHSGRHLDTVAAAHHNHGIRLLRVDQPAEAVASFEKAVATRRHLMSEVSPSYEPDVAHSLDGLAAALVRCGRAEEACARWEEALRLRATFHTRSDALRRLLARPVESWPSGTADTVANSLASLVDDLGSLQLAVGARSDRRRLQETTSQLGSTAATFLARDRGDVSSALRWVHATASLESRLIGERRSAELERLRADAPGLAKKLLAAVEIADREPDAVPPADVGHQRRSLPADVLGEIRDLPDFHDFLWQPTVEEIAGALGGRAAVVVVPGTGGGVLLSLDPKGELSASTNEVDLDTLLDGVHDLLVAELKWERAEDEQEEDRWAEAILTANLHLSSLVSNNLLAQLEQAAPADGGPLVVVPIGYANWLPIQATASLAGLTVEVRPTLTWRPADPPVLQQRPAIVYSNGEPPPEPGDPTQSLREAYEEAVWLAELVDEKPLVDPEATPPVVLRAMEGSAYLHLACHGVADLTDPNRSGLLLGGQTLTLRELNRRLNSGPPPVFVGLNACQTARSDVTAPEQNTSLASLFLAHGSRAVLATHWNVIDVVARLFSEAFVTAWMKPGTTVGEAYDRALLSVDTTVRESDRLPTSLLRNLYGFTLFGDRRLLWPTGPRSAG